MKLPLTLASLAALAFAASGSLHAAAFTAYGDASTVYATGVKVTGGLPVYFSSGNTAGQGAPDTMKGQALQTMQKLEENIAAAGFKLSDVVFVRAYLAPAADGKIDYAGWNAAWGEVFGTARFPHKPARTTVGVPLLGRPGTYIEIEYVCAKPDEPGLFASSDKLGLPVSNPMLKPYGTKEGRIYNGVGIKAGSAYYWTAGVGAAVLKPDLPQTSPDRYGDMKTQAAGTLKNLEENLASVGLTFKDVIYLRAFVGPDKLRGGKFDLDGWNAAYSEYFNNSKNPHKPARTTVTTPTYGSPGAMIEIELLAAFPGSPDKVKFDSTTNPNLKAYGAPTAAIASGVAAKAGSSFYFSAGAGPKTGGGDMKTQALSALDTLKTRLAEAGLGFKDVTFLRAYVVPEADGSVDRTGWGEAYTTYFNNKDQPHKPARTTIAVHSLPRPDWKIEIDVIAAAP
jgi:enamine deaminase RidA (YjgF/YER057c/UK114 family)